MPVEAPAAPPPVKSDPAPKATPIATPPPAEAKDESVFDSLQKYADTEGPTGQPKPAVKSKETAKPAAKKDAAEPVKDKAPPKEPEKKEIEKPAVEDDLLDPKVDAEPKKDAPKPDDTTAEPKKNGWRMYHDEQKAHKATQAEVQRLKEQLTASPKDDPEKVSLKQERDKYAERLKSLEDEIRYVNYEKSPEYLEKWQKPYEETAQSALGEATELKIQLEDGQTRASTPEDFWKVASTPNADDALVLAEQLYGEKKAAYVMQLRARVREAHRAGQKAKEEYRVKGSEREKQTREEHEKSSKAMNERFDTLTAELSDKMLKPDEGDEKANEYLKRGIEIADAAFRSNKPDPERDAKVRTMAADYPRKLYKLKIAQKRIEELESQLAEFQDSEPKEGEVDKTTKDVKEHDIYEGLDALAR